MSPGKLLNVEVKKGLEEVKSEMNCWVTNRSRTRLKE